MKLPETCPYLPTPDLVMNHRCLTQSKRAPCAHFYTAALKYGHYLWLKNHAGRSILAITRALYADVAEGSPILEQWPLPYSALRWIVETHNSAEFPGNPRISFQHQATRLRGGRRDLRRARAWAVWALIRRARPDLPGDPAQAIEEPTVDWIAIQLRNIGHAKEVTLWQAALNEAGK